MPRRSSNRISSSLAVEPHHPQPQPPPDPVSEHLSSLRQHWKWAAFCQFFHTFFDLLAINDISIEDLESDLVHGTDVFLPRIMQRLLFTLSYDRKISADNWQNALRRQYDKRDPEANPLGSPTTAQTASNSRFSSIVKDEVENTQDETQEQKDEETAGQADGASTRHTSPQTDEKPSNKANKRAVSAIHENPTVDWSSLTMDQKLVSLHTLVEWQFQNPTRLRMIMKSDDEFAAWRAEPIGYDREQNAYWLIGENRLWIQRSPPKPPSRKRKRKAPVDEGPKGRNAKATSSKRQKLTKTKSKKAEPAPVPPTPISGRSRAAKEQAKAKLDAQAKALAEFNKQAAVSTRSASTRSTRSRDKQEPKAAAAKAFKSGGVRMSARLRGLPDDDWEPVPEEWLESDEQPSKNAKTGLESDADSISDLTELSDDEEQDAPKDEEEEEKPASANANENQDNDAEREEVQGATTSSPFVEWETLCVTIAEWEQFPERFAKSTHYAERAFFKLLTNVIVPQVVGELKAIEQKRRVEEALNHRKRSSRLATRENEREAARLAVQKKAEEDEKMSRTRRLEARQKREEDERAKRENAREERRMKRERAAEEAAVASEEPPSPKEEAPPPPPPARPEPAPKRQASKPRPKKAAATKAADDWELECEVCGRKGTNLDDGVPMMSCGSCSKWQHIQCHDKRDRALGRPKRDWDRIEFLCQRCDALRQNRLQRANGTSHYTSQHVQPAAPYTQSWQSQALYSAGKPQGYAAQETPNYAHPQSYLAPTSSLRSSYPNQTAYPNAYSTNPISFNHYQPQERSFANDSRGQVPQNHYYRTNGSWSVDPTRYHQSYPSQNAWNPNHYAANGSSSSAVPSHSAGGAPVLDRRTYPHENGNSAHAHAHHHPSSSAYETAVNRDPYRHQQAPVAATTATTPAVSYHRTPYAPHS